jgi:Outer membrane lipoprotein carrier protein LolA-like
MRVQFPLAVVSLLAAILMMAAPAANAANTAEWGMDQLMQDLALIRSNRATFVEKKFIAIIDKPVESSGELFYNAPDRLEKRTLKPKPESMILEQSTLIIERGRQKHRLALQDYPELSAFIDSIRGTLAGDRKALERSFRLNLSGSAEQWTLQLVPLSDKMLSVVKNIRIGGARDVVRSIETNQADGDRSLMLIERLAAP